MTINEFRAAFEIAKSKMELSEANASIGVFDGFGLPEFKPVTVTLNQVARLIRYQANQMNGGWDSDAMNEIRECGKTKFTIADLVTGPEHGIRRCMIRGDINNPCIGCGHNGVAKCTANDKLFNMG